MKRTISLFLTISLALVTVPTPSSPQGAERTLRCWRCQKTFTVPEKQLGKTNCPHCGAQCLIVPPTPIPTPRPVPTSSPIPGSEPPIISWRDGASYVGQTKSVEGTIVGTHLSPRSGSLYLNFSSDYKTYVSIKISPEDLIKFPSGAADYYQGKNVVATGEIVRDRDYLRLVVTDPANLKVVR